MIKTKYGNLPLETIETYKSKLVGRVYKILPMAEEECQTWSIYIESLLFELTGNKELINNLSDNADFLSLLGSLESLTKEHNIEIIKREVFKCLGLVKRF